MIAIVLLFGLSAAGITETDLREWYVRDSDRAGQTGYPRVAVNRFREAGQDRVERFLERSPYYYRSVEGRRVELDEDGKQSLPGLSLPQLNAVLDVVVCAPELKQYSNELYVSERITTGGGHLNAFHIFRFAKAGDAEPTWLSSFVYRTDDACLSPALVPETVDMDRGGSGRELWDVLDQGDRRYLLVRRSEYEVRRMELYRVVNGDLVLELEFDYACLGCP